MPPKPRIAVVTTNRQSPPAMSALRNLEFSFEAPSAGRLAPCPPASLADELAGFQEFGTATRRLDILCAQPDGQSTSVPAFVNEFWTARQRQASSLHEISYRACFKPQLPRFFIERLTRPGEVVYDPFMGRGTTLVEAALLGRVPFGCDINPLSQVFGGSRLRPPKVKEVEERLKTIPLDDPADEPEDLLVFYHPETLRKLSSLKKYFQTRRRAQRLDALDLWLEMVCLNRLTGHSPGFFSGRTMPPNQAVSVKSQRKINERLKQTPPARDVLKVILKKSRLLLGDVTPEVAATLAKVAPSSKLVTGPANQTPDIPSASVALVVTSPPFLDIVDYATDNWLRCWFLDLDAKAVRLTVPRKLEDWAAAMTEVFRELHRVLRSGGHIAFEVGEVRGGKIKLEETVVPCGLAVGLEPELILINDQEFTKTANCWGVDNNSRGTNTNRIVLFRKP
jgi:hypothetical protein